MAGLALNIPDFGQMSDEEVEKHPLSRSFDGRWSAQTRWLLETFGTDRLELNEAWSMTSTLWICPCCKRTKPEIARLTEQGVLLCQLDVHHDHLADLAGDILRQTACEEIEEESLRTKLRACSAAMPLIERFAKVLVCNDCNAADGAMKAALGSQVHAAFSFSPDEIAAFIRPRSNQKHEIDEDLGEQVWSRANQHFLDRLEFANRLAERIGRGLHDREVHGFTDPEAQHDDARLLFKLAWERGGPRQRPSGIGQSLLARSRATAGRLSGDKKRASRRAHAPSEHDFRELDGQRNASPPWRKSGPDWRCPVCSRSKFEITRKSNKGAWTAAIMELSDYVEEVNPQSLQRRSSRHDLPYFLGEHRAVLVCHDCRQVVTNAVTLLPGQPDHCLRIQDIQNLVGAASAHQSHEIDRADIVRIAAANEEWIRAVDDFWAHREEAHDASFQLLRLMRNLGLDEAQARFRLIKEFVAAGKLPSHEAESWLDWLLTESARLSER